MACHAKAARLGADRVTRRQRCYATAPTRVHANLSLSRVTGSKRTEINAGGLARPWVGGGLRLGTLSL